MKAGSEKEVQGKSDEAGFDEWQGITREGAKRDEDSDENDDDTPDNYNANYDNDRGVMMPIDASF